jgi:lipoteichoic acid synthase
MMRHELTDQRSAVRARQLSVLAMAFDLCVLAIFIRAANFYYPIKTYWDARWIAKETFHHSYYDIATVFCVTLFASLALILMRRNRTSQGVIAGLYYAFAALMALLFCVNSRALEVIGGSLTYQWLYYADFFRSFTSRSAVTSTLDSSILTLLALSFLALTVGFWLLKLLLQLMWRYRFSRLMIGFSLLLTVVYLVYVRGWVHANEINYREIANPLVELISTALVGDTNTLSRLPTSFADTDFRIGNSTDPASSRYKTTQRVRNVVLIVMESVGANYVIGSRLFGKGKSPVDATPHLTGARAAGITFNHFYAHAPMSTKSIFSMLASRHPLFSYATEISKIGNAPLATLSSRLKEEGYRTGFFMSGDFKFQGVDSFLAGRGFDVLSDMNTISCATPTFAGSTTAWPNLDSVDDECTVAALSNWIGDGKGAPFFGMMWTGNTHWPYFSSGEQAQFSDDDPHLNRYLNALRSSDASIGELLEHLRQHGLANETLVVVIGDHGEAFGEHGAQVHGNNVFEEEVHIPLLLVNPNFRGDSEQAVGGLVDLAPTILDVLEIEAPLAWQGRSMFAIERSPRVYFMAPNSEMIAGYREGDSKFIFNLARNKISVFDLERDPGETRNIVQEMGEAAKEVPERLAAWVQYQEKLFTRRTIPLP